MAKIAIGKAVAALQRRAADTASSRRRGHRPARRACTSSSVKANGRIQKLKLFMRGSAMSGAPTCSGISSSPARPRPASRAPKIMNSACMVVIELKNCGSTNCRPGWNSSARMTIAIAPPMKNIRPANTRYIVPMSL